MFSSKFLSGANPLNAVSSAVNKFGLFGDDSEGDKNQKAPAQQPAKPPAEQQPGGGQTKGPQQQPGPQKSGQSPSMQKSQPLPKQGSPQPSGKGQAGPPSKPGGQVAPKSRAQPEGQLKDVQQKQQTPSSPKPGAQQQTLIKSSTKPESPKATSQQVAPTTGMQKQNLVKSGTHQEPTKSGSPQGPPKVGQESPRTGQQPQGSAKPSQQQPATAKVAQQQQGPRTTPQQGSQPQGPKRPVTAGATKAGALCPVCKTTELNLNAKEPPNHKICTQCRKEVCSLCGFSPPDSDGREWLCLNCQLQRAQGTSEPQGASIKKSTPNKVSATQSQPPSASPIKRETSPSNLPMKMQSTSSKAPAQGEVGKVPESQKQASPAATQKVQPKTERTEKPQKTDHTNQNANKHSSVNPAPRKESGGLFGLGAAKPEATKAEESVTGKMFGFGSSIFSSASTLIVSAVQDDPKTTPPVSPKMAPAKESKGPVVPQPEQDKKQAEPTQIRASPARQVKMANGPTQTQKDTAACPLCKTVLNMGSKDPPNYNSCTECKSTVCNQCGFNPMPNVKEGKEWLCLNCQVKRATSGTEHKTAMNSSVKKPPTVHPTQPKTSAPGSPQKKTSTSAAQPPKVEAPGQKSPMEIRKTVPQSGLGQTKEPVQKQENASAPAQQQTGGFFGFGSSKIPTSPAKPADSVAGKMFGLGSSIFSSASTLISSSAQDESKITPPVSPKMSFSKDTKSSAAQKPDQENNSVQPHAKGALPTDGKGKPPPEQLGRESGKQKQSVCPLCKLELNIGSKDLPNYSTCTMCKNMVCNQCGFNPMPNVTEAKEWLCLNCQMQRALGASEPPGTPATKPQASPNTVSAPTNSPKKEPSQLDQSQKKNFSTGAESKISEPSAPSVPQKKQTITEKQSKADIGKRPDSQKIVGPGPSPGSKTPEKTGQKPPDETHQTELKKINTTSGTQEESKGFFGFGGAKPQQDSAKSAESLGGKMFGFGSSIFNSASNLINTAVQDEQKLQTMKETSPLPQTETKKASSEQLKDASVLSKVSTCPLCKVELNLGSKETSNYKNCTECKKTVCVQCGFNPTPNMSEAKEWLCLNCQTQRALSASELTAHPMKTTNTTNKPSPSVTLPKTTPSNPMENINKELLKSDTVGKTETPVASKGSPKSSPQKVVKRPESDPQDSSASLGSKPQKPADQANQAKAKEIKDSQIKQQESRNVSGLSSPKTRPDSAKTTESVTGKMFGFGSSIFSSASTLISSAVQEESRTTPPSSRKMSAPPHVSSKISAVPKTSSPPVSPKIPAAESKTKNPEPIKKPDLSKQESAPSQTPIMASTTKKAENACCPLCKGELNIDSKDPANYNTCTECKTIVCNQCGFNPMPIGKVKEWLCLNCQMKRAVGASEPPGLPTKVPEKSQVSTGNVSAPATQKLDESSKPPKSLKRDLPTSSVSKDTPESITSQREVSASPGKLDSKEKQVTIPKKPPDQASKPASKQSAPVTDTERMSGGFFGFGSPKSQPDAAKPAVAEKMFGFGSSIFSSASTLITSAVQEQPKTTPPVSPNMSPAKNVRSPSAQKMEQQKKTEPPQQVETPAPEVAKSDKVQPKAAVASQDAVKPCQSTCPLCKITLNVGSKDAPNYNTCTECKNLVCNQCGFNPMPNETVVKEWLCLTCQMQRTLKPPEATSVNAPITAKSLKKEPAKTDNKAPHSPQRMSAGGQPVKTEELKSLQAKMQESLKMQIPNKTPNQPIQSEQKEKKGNLATQQDSGGLFGFGGGKSSSSGEKSAESLTGKMFGFGSSIFGSASSLMTSAVQDQPQTSPSISPKMSPAKEIKLNAVENKDQKKTPQQAQQSKKPPLVESKLDKMNSEPLKSTVSEETAKTNPSSCPLCKSRLNIGSKNLPNYSTCTKCSTTVCNQCGFNPMPNVSENKEWLCLTCQMKQALSAAESIEPPMKPKASPNKVSTASATSEMKEIVPTEEAEKLDENHQKVLKANAPIKEETMLPEETSGSNSTPTKEEKTVSDSTTKVKFDTTSLTKGTTAVTFDNNLAQPIVVDKDIKTSQSPPATKDIDKKEENVIKLDKSTDQIKPSIDEVIPKETMTREANHLESSLPESTPSGTQPINQESGGFFSSSRPKPQHATSKTAEAVTGKMLGFGSSLFSSASTLITSAVQESRTTPPSSRKMSAPAQVSASEIPPKSSTPVSPKTASTETKPPTTQKPQMEKKQDKPLQAKVTTLAQTKADRELSEPGRSDVAPEVGKSTCPLCKADLNLGSKDPANYKTCTECKTLVCSKCGFSPMPSIKEGSEWLCLNCQMQRALGASEPPGFPMIKSPTLPHKEVPATTQKEKSPTSASQEVIPKQDLTKSNVPKAGEPEDSFLGVETKKEAPSGVSLSDKPVSATITKAGEKILDKTAKGQPTHLDQKPAKQDTSAAKSTPDQETKKQEPSKDVTSMANSSLPTAPETVKSPPQKQPTKEHPKVGTSPAKSAQPPPQPPKQDSGGFFGFGGPKVQPSVAQSAESVTGKMFGFGSSFLSSASTFITSAVQDESKTTPPTPRKMSTAEHASPKVTPPASPKVLPVKDTKAPKTEEKRPEKPQQAPPTAKTEKTQPEEAKAPTDKKGVTKTDLFICPLCKVQFNLDSKDPPKYNTCTQCKTAVCSQCGFNPKPNVLEVKEWLCLNCQIQRTQGESESTGLPAVKTLPSPSKLVTVPVSEKKAISTEAQKEKPTVAKKEVTVKQEASDSNIVTLLKTETPQSVSTEKKQVVSITESKQGQEKSPQVQISQKPKPDVKAKQETGKPPPQPPKTTPPMAKTAPTPAAQPAKQESGGFFGFSGPKTQPAKSSESMTGKMFGFGSSIFSSASTLITSAVQDEPKTTPPSLRKTSTPGQTPAKTTPPVSPAKKSETSPQVKAASSAKVKEEKGPSEPPKFANKDQVPTCPLCKVELNMGTKDPPNYNSCTECKNTVCNLCGFNPTPHTGVEEWLCLSCQTQRALSGQLGDSGKMSQPSPVSPKPESSTTLVLKNTELIPVTEESSLTSDPIKETHAVPSTKGTMDPSSVKPGNTATLNAGEIKSETTSSSPAAESSPNTGLVFSPETKLTSVLPLKETAPKPQAAVPNIIIPTTVKTKEIDPNMPKHPGIEVSEITTGTTHTVTEKAVVPPSTVVAKVALAGTDHSTEKQAELSTEDCITKEVPSDDHITETQTTKSSQQVEMQLTLQKPHLEATPEIVVAEKDRSAKVAKAVGIISSEEMTKGIVIKEQAESMKEPMTERRVSLTAGVEMTVIKPESKAEAHDETEPQILPISQELEGHIVSDMSEKTEVKPQRRRLSFQAGDDSSETEVTPSPKVQRRRLEVTNISSSSEDIKTESPDSYMEDEDFIRQQIMGMGDEEQMSPSEEEKEKAVLSTEPVKEAELDNSKISKEDRTTELPKPEDEIVQQTTQYKKAIPVMRQGTDEDIDSITESPSKGSSSVQASSFTTESSHTSASSLEEDSDSSPSHRKISGDKQHRKGKYRQPKLPLPIIEDSSEDEKFKKEEKSRKDKDDLAGQPLSPADVASSPNDLRQVVVEETSRTSGSEFSASTESEPEIRQAVQIGSKPSPTVIPYTPAEPFIENTVTKVLKSAEEAYEEIIQKTKDIPGESPDIEPLYGGMAIEDYLYESLVEGSEIKISETKDEDLQRDSGSESIKKLRSPEEVYEEMMQKKRELMMIEEEFQQAQTAMESSFGDLVTAPSLVAETCIVTISTEESSITDEANVSSPHTEIPGEVPVKKKKRPAPPRPSEPPKRSEVSCITPGRSTGFVRPMTPQDPALRKALFPIPDLKITQCSSGEEEDDSLADEYGVGVSSDITPSDDSETKEGPPASPTFYETAEIEPICVVCEIPEPKPIPTPISAPELTATPSPVSPVSPTTSSPDSSLESNATSSPSFKDQTPLSPDSTTLSTPTPPTSFVTQSSSDISPPSPVTTAVHVGGVSYPTSSTVVVTIPDVVSNQAKTQTTVVAQAKESTETQHPLEKISTPSPIVVQMPDLVSSPSQVPSEPPAPIQVSAAGPLPAVISSQSTGLVSTIPVNASSSASVQDVSPSVTLASDPGPVIVQMPDLVSTTAPICGQTPQPVSALVTQAQALAQAKVVHSISVQPVTPYTSPVLIPTVAQTAASTSTTIVKKKVPPPPPPRSTSVSVSEPIAEQLLVKTDQHFTPTLTTTAMGTAVPGQPMKSVIVDIQPRMEEILADNMAVASTRKGHVVIIVPSAETTSLHGQTTQDLTNNVPTVSTPSLAQNKQVAAQLESKIPSNDAMLPSSKTPAEIVVSPKPVLGSGNVQEPSPSLPATTHKPPVHPKPQVPTAVTVTSASTTVVTTISSYQPAKPPPPIPPKPTSIPAGLVFSHKPGESVKPPPVVPKAATLPRTKEPPNALSLSLTRPVESKLGTTSPKSPLSPRHAKCLQTYVVITLPSELGSPPEAITVQAPMRRGSIPSTKASDIQTLEQSAPTEVFSAQTSVRMASVPHVRHPPPNIAGEQVQLTDIAVVVPTEVQVSRDYVLSVAQTTPSVADDNQESSSQESYIKLHSVPAPIKKPYIQLQQQIPLPTTQGMPEIQPPIEEEQSQSIVPHPDFTSGVTTEVSNVSAEAPVPQTQTQFVPLEPQPQTDVVTQQQEPELLSEVIVPQDNTVSDPYVQIEKQIETQQDISIDVIVTDEVLRRSQPHVSQQIPPQPLTIQSIDNPCTIVEVPSALQTVQLLDILPPVAQYQFLEHSLPVTEVVTPPTKTSAEAFTTESVKVSEVTPLLTATQPLTVAAEFSQSNKVFTMYDGASLSSVAETQQISGQQDKSHGTDIPQVSEEILTSVVAHPTPQLALMPLQSVHDTPKETLTDNVDPCSSLLSSLSSVQPQTMTGIPVEIIATEETTMRRRASITSTVHSPYTTNQIFNHTKGYEIPTQVTNTEAFTSSRRESITIQHPLQMVQVVSMPAERDLHTDGHAVQVHYEAGSIPLTEQRQGVLSYSSEYDQPLEIITTEAFARRTSAPTAQDIGQETGASLAPVTITKFQQESIESQQIRGPEKVVSSMSHMYSSISTAGQPPESLPSLVTQVVTTEVQRTTVSVVHERLPQVPPPSIAVTIQPDLAKVQPLPKQNGRIMYPGDVIDLRTIKTGVKMTGQGMDLTPPESHRQSFLSDYTGRQITAVQPEIVNLSSEITPAPTLSVVTDNITIVTCTATISSYNNTPAEKPLDLQGPVTSLPLPLTTCKPFEPLAQIVYKPLSPKAVVHAVTAQDTPINLSFGVSAVSKQSPTQGTISNGRPIVSLEATGAIDLSNYKPVRAMVALSGTSSGVVTSVVEDDGIPVDLTAGRRSVCCDVIYKLPFTGSCRTQPPVTNQPDGLYGSKGTTDVKASVTDSNLMETGIYSYDTKSDHNYLNGSSDRAIDLTAAHLSAGKAQDYTIKATGSYPRTTTTPHSQVPAAGFGVNSVLRTSDGIVYSSVAAPVPSTYAITTQPGSIFSTTLTPSSTVQNEALSHLYGFIPSADPGQLIPFDPGLGKELLPTALADIISGYPDIYSDTTLEAIAASLDALSSSPIFPGLDNSKMAQYQMEREFLELEKLKQLCLAEELEWERQEIQRYREQEQFMVQREIEELQALKQQLLLQQEEEHHAHMVAQQETYAQQKEQLHQIQQLQLQLQRQLDEHYGSTGTTANLLDAKYAGVGDSGQYWPVKDEGTAPSGAPQSEESQEQLNVINKHRGDQDIGKKIIDSGVQTDDEDSSGKHHVGRRRKNKKNIDSDTSGQTDDEDQDEWDVPTKARRRSRKHSGDGKHGSKVSSIAIQTVAEISVQTDHSGTIKKPNVQMDTKVEIIKHISAPENSQTGGSLSCQTESDRRHTPIELDYNTHLTADIPSKSKVFYNQVCPLSPEKSSQRMLTADPSRFSSGPRILKAGQKSLSDPKPLSPMTEDRMSGYYIDSYSGRGSPSGTGKKVKRTLPDPPPEDDSLTGRSGYSTNSARRRLARSTTIARAKILQDIDKELDLVERESSKLRKKQAELDEEEKEIDAKLRYLEMGINRRKEALLKEREKRERAYLQGVAEERDYMSDSEVSNIREARGEGLERPRTAPQSEFDQFIPPQTEADSQYNTLTSPYSPYAQYVPQTQTTSHFTQQSLYQQPSLYQVSPYPTLSLSHGQTQSSSYQHALLLQQGKQHQSSLSDLEPKITSNYEVIRNQPLLIVSTSTDSGYGVPHLGGKYANVDLRLGLEERSMASSPMSSISADSFYADIDHHNARNYVLIEDIGELTKTSSALSSTGLGSGFSLPDKELSKADRLLRATEARRTAEVADFLGSSRLQTFGKGEDDTMEDPYELKLLKQQIKQEFRRGTDGLEHLAGLGLPHYIPSDSSFRHFHKGEKYSIGRLTLEKQAAKQLPAAVLYQKQMKNKKALIDPKAITKFSPIQESRDLEPDFTTYMGSGASSVTNLAATARLLQDEITFGLRKNLAEQQKYLGSSLGGNLAGSLNLGQSLGLGSSIRATGQDDGTYPSGSRSRPSSRPSSRPTSVYGLDLSIKRDLSSSSLRLKTEGDVLDAAFAPGVARAKPTSLPISQSRGRIPIVAQNSEEESPLSPVGQPMGMARASAGPLPPISADSRDQFGSSHSLPEVQQHMREESRTRGYERDTAFIVDDLQGAMSDSEAYHLRREDTDWFDKPREGHPRHTDRRQMKLVPYACPHMRIKLKKDPKETRVSGNGLGIRVVGGKEIPGRQRECGAYIAKVFPGGVAEQTGKVVEGMQVLEWNGIPLTAKTYEEVQGIIGQPCAEVELCVRLDLNMLSDPEHPQALEHHVQLKAGGQRSPGVDPKQLAAELQKVSQQQAPGMVGSGIGSGSLGVLSALERSALLHSGTGSAASSGVPSPGQPASPAINKKQRSKPIELMKAPHPITGEIQLQINYDRNLGNLIVHVLQARNLAPRDNDSYSDPFVKVYLLPGRGQVMVVQNASADNKRRTRYAQKTMNPEWNQTVIYKNIHLEQLKKKTLEVTVWDYDRSSSNDFLGEVLIDLSNTAQLDNVPRWLPLKEQSESIEHNKAHHAAQGPSGPGSGQGHGQGHGYMSSLGPGQGFGPGQAPGQGDGSHDSHKNSVIKSRSHGIFPDPAKDLQMMPLEKSHSSPGSSKSSSDGQLRSHGPSRSQSKSSVTQAHLEDAGIAIAAAEAAVQQSCLQPRPGHRLSDVSGSVVLSAPSLVGDAFGGLDEDDGEGTGVDSAIFQVPHIGKTIPNGTDKLHLGTPENEGGKTQVMGEIKVALKKEVKTEGDQLVLEILQCRNITYKFKSPDHLPDLYVKLYVVNVATQKRIIKKKTRVCRHDREPSFNETFRFPLNPTGHSIQLFLVSNGGKFMKKTLIGEAYIWLDKVDMRKRVVSWHKLFVSSTQTNP